MGMFKDMKQGFDVIRSDDLKEIKKKADAQPKTNPLDALKQANQMMDQAADLQQNQQGFMNMGQIYANGISGNATVVALRETGKELNGAPIMDIDLTVNLPGREPYQMTHQQAIAPGRRPTSKPARCSRCRAIPTTPTRRWSGS